MITGISPWWVLILMIADVLVIPVLALVCRVLDRIEARRRSGMPGRWRPRAVGRRLRNAIEDRRAAADSPRRRPGYAPTDTGDPVTPSTVSVGALTPVGAADPDAAALTGHDRRAVDQPRAVFLPVTGLPADLARPRLWVSADTRRRTGHGGRCIRAGGAAPTVCPLVRHE